MRKRSIGALTVQISDMIKKEARKILFFDELDSTNTYAKNAKEIENGTAVLAKVQTAGHGRIGRKFYSSEGGIYLSLCRKTSLKATELTSLTGICAVAVSDAIKKVCGVCPKIKWTNDLLLECKKICGILVENVFDGTEIPERVIIGVGINASQPKEAFDGELSGIASSISVITGKTPDTAELILAVLDELDSAFDILERGTDTEEYIRKYRENCVTLGKEIYVLKQEIGKETDVRKLYEVNFESFPKAVALDIDRNMGLVVKYEDGRIQTLHSGEVSIRQV